MLYKLHRERPHDSVCVARRGGCADENRDDLQPRCKLQWTSARVCATQGEEGETYRIVSPLALFVSSEVLHQIQYISTAVAAHEHSSSP